MRTGDLVPLTDSIDGRPTTLGGYEAYVERDTGTSRACTVQVPYRPAQDLPSATLDVLMVTVIGDRKGVELCRPEAKRLAAVAAVHLHRP